MKNKNTWIIIGVIAAIFLIFIYAGGKKEKTSNGNGGTTSQLTDDDGIISAEFLDDNGNPLSSVLSRRTFSTVTGASGTVKGATQMRLTVTATNTGNESLVCDIISASPTQFNERMVRTTKIVPVTSPRKASWTSDLISLAQFEGLGPQTFSATISCKYSVGIRTITLTDKTGTLPLTITSDEVNAGFEVGVDSGGLESEYCGDGICQAANNEDAYSCPSDCAVASYSKFRTTDLSYISSSAIAFDTSSCGNTLTAYGASTSGSSTSGACSSFLSAGIIMSNIPCSYSGCVLGRRGTDTYVCWVNVGGYSYRKYDTSDSDASKVSTTPTSFDLAKEVACT